MATAAFYTQHGPPFIVVAAERQDLAPPGAGEVCVSRILAPINPADLNAIEGVYATLPPLPAIPGVEGVGLIEAAGPDVPGAFAPGRAVIFPHGYGTWRDAGNIAADRLILVPPGIPYTEAAMIKINPATAWRMLHDFVTLKPGDWVMLNAANSAVGRHVIAIAREMEVKTLNFVRRPELIDELTAAGATAVFLDNEEGTKAAKELLASSAPPRLALNAVGGESALRLASLLDHGGIHVTYGAMSRQALKIPAGQLIFKDLHYRGFWVSHWYQVSEKVEQEAMFAQLFELARLGIIRTPVEQIYPIAQVKDAIAHATRGAREGKILLGTL